jgi:hypothetical protein
MLKIVMGETEAPLRLPLDPDPRWGTEHDPRYTLCQCPTPNPNIVICACCVPGKRECLGCGLPIDDLGQGL